MKSKPNVRLVMRADLDRIVEIDAACGVPAWTEDRFLNFMRQPRNWGVVSFMGRGGRVDGFVLYSLESKSVKVRKLCVDTESRRRGLGTALLRHIKTDELGYQRPVVTVSVWGDNLGASLFLKANGFRATLDSNGVVDDIYRFSYREPCAQVKCDSIFKGRMGAAPKWGGSQWK